MVPGFDQSGELVKLPTEVPEIASPFSQLRDGDVRPINFPRQQPDSSLGSTMQKIISEEVEISKRGKAYLRTLMKMYEQKTGEEALSSEDMRQWHQMEKRIRGRYNLQVADQAHSSLIRRC